MNNEKYTPKEVSELMKSRTMSDAELIEEGEKLTGAWIEGDAEYVQDDNAREPRLAVNIKGSKLVKDEVERQRIEGVKKEGVGLLDTIIKNATDEEVKSLEVRAGKTEEDRRVLVAIRGKLGGREIDIGQSWYVPSGKKFSFPPTLDILIKGGSWVYIDKAKLDDPGSFFDEIVQRKEEVENRRLFNDPAGKHIKEYKV